MPRIQNMWQWPIQKSALIPYSALASTIQYNERIYISINERIYTSINEQIYTSINERIYITIRQHL